MNPICIDCPGALLGDCATCRVMFDGCDDGRSRDEDRDADEFGGDDDDDGDNNLEVNNG